MLCRQVSGTMRAPRRRLCFSYKGQERFPLGRDRDQKHEWAVSGQSKDDLAFLANMWCRGTWTLASTRCWVFAVQSREEGHAMRTEKWKEDCGHGEEVCPHSKKDWEVWGMVWLTWRTDWRQHGHRHTGGRPGGNPQKGCNENFNGKKKQKLRDI